MRHWPVFVMLLWASHGVAHGSAHHSSHASVDVCASCNGLRTHGLAHHSWPHLFESCDGLQT